MYRKPTYIAYFLVFLFIGIIAERSIPHTHVKHNGIVTPKFANNNDSDNPKEQDSEQLHATYFFSESNLQFSVPPIFLNERIQIQTEKIAVKNSTVNNYNLFPKILNSILFVANSCSPNAPPFLIYTTT